MSVAGGMLEEIMNSGEGTMPLDGRVEFLARLRDSGKEAPAEIDRVLLERVMRQHEALSNVQEEHGKLRGLLESLTEPPYFPAIFLATANTPEVHGALVQTDNERRVVQFGAGIDPKELTPGAEVFLSHERNFLVAISGRPGILTGDVAQFVRGLSDGRMVLKFQDQEVVVFANEALCNAAVKAGDSVRFSRGLGLAFEKIDRAKGEQFFLESTPSDSFEDIGGLDGVIESLKLMLTLHALEPATTGRYKLPRKRSALFQGPPGNGKTKLARATCNWLATMSASGRARFMNVKPGGLNSMWFGATENNYREIFRVAREAAAAEPGVPVVIFFDEIDAIGTSRGESVHRIDDRMLNALMAELDGLEARGNIVVLAATNRMDTLDPALLRFGRMGDLVLHIPQPNRKAAHAILNCHLPADIPYAANGEGTAAAREALLHLAVAQLFAANAETELANLTLRDGKRRLVRASDLVSGAQLESIAQAAIERACVREVRGGPSGVTAEDVSAAISGFFLGAPRALTPRNARNYIHDLPQDNDVVSVNLVERKVSRQHLYRVEAA
jgi:proteasome-associated ATPase